MNHEQLLLYIQEVLQDIIGSTSSFDDLMQDKQKVALIQSILEAMDRLGQAYVNHIPAILQGAYNEGMDEATTALSEVIASQEEVTSSKQINAATQAAVITKAIESAPSKIQKRIHLDAINNIVEDTLIDLRAAIRTAKINAEKSIESTLKNVQEDIVKGMIIGDPRAAVKKRVAESFVKDGLTSFITKDGKRLPLDYYSKLVVATKTRDAHVNGANNRYMDAGVTLVQIHEQSDTCPVCAKYKDMVVSISGEDEGFKSKDEVKLPPYHPHCHGTTRPYVTAFKTDDEIKKEMDKWKKWDPDKDTRTVAQKRAYEKEQAIRRKANEEKKQYARYKMALGDDAPKTLGAFRRMKRSNTVKYQELQAEYRRVLREDVN